MFWSRLLKCFALFFIITVLQACKVMPKQNPDACQGPVFTKSDIEFEFKPLKRVAPIMPSDFIRAAKIAQNSSGPRHGRDVTAKVGLEFVANADGSVCDVSVTESSGIVSVDEAAVVAIKKWRFEPVMVNEKPGRVLGTQTIDFTIEAR